MGINGYSEAKEVLQVGLHLMDIFNEQTDIDTVYIARTNDNQSVSLYQRTNYANTVSASWYHSVHSDASANTNTNRTLMLWGQLNSGEPDPPVGGEEMSDKPAKAARPVKLNVINEPKDSYTGGKSSLCPGCGHDQISNVIISAAWESGIEPHRIAKMSGIGCSSKTQAYYLGKSH